MNRQPSGTRSSCGRHMSAFEWKRVNEDDRPSVAGFEVAGLSIADGDVGFANHLGDHTQRSGLRLGGRDSGLGARGSGLADTRDSGQNSGRNVGRTCDSNPTIPVPTRIPYIPVMLEVPMRVLRTSTAALLGGPGLPIRPRSKRRRHRRAPHRRAWRIREAEVGADDQESRGPSPPRSMTSKSCSTRSARSSSAWNRRLPDSRRP